MPHIRKILCPLDLQTAAFDALHSASQLATHYNAELVVLNVVPSLVPPAARGLIGELIYASTEYTQERQEHARQELNQALRGALPPGVTARALVTIGRIPQKIIEVAEAENCDLIVMEPHNASGLGTRLFGSNCEKVLRQSEIPIWLARPAVPDQNAGDDAEYQAEVTGSARELEPLEIRKILCTTDGSEPARASLQSARDMALEWDAELCVLHVYEPLLPVMGVVADEPFHAELRREAREIIANDTQGFERAGVRLRPLIRGGIPALEILDTISEEQPDVTIIATHGHTTWARLIMGSVAEPVARLAPCPVLTFQGTKVSPETETDRANQKAPTKQEIPIVIGPVEPQLPISSFSPQTNAASESNAETANQQQKVAPATAATSSSPTAATPSLSNDGETDAQNEPQKVAPPTAATPSLSPTAATSSLPPSPTVATSSSNDEEMDEVWKVKESDFPDDGTREEKLEFLLGYAILAPSNRNTQPWLWRITDEGLELYADTTRSLPKVDPNDRELFIACGAALFNLRVALRYFGCEFETHILPDLDAPDLLARIAVDDAAQKARTSGPTGIEAAENAELFVEITRRHTSRGLFEDRPLEAGLHVRLKQAAHEEGALLRFIEDDERERVAELVKRATVFQASDPWLRHEWEKWIRDAPQARDDGLQREAVGLGADEKPSSYGSYVKRSKRDKEFAESAPTLVLLETEGDTPRDWLKAGAALQHVLLLARGSDVFASYFNQIIEVTDVWRTMRDQLGLLRQPQLLFRPGHSGRPRPSAGLAASPRQGSFDFRRDGLARAGRIRLVARPE